jgi:hypothetical protein
VPVTKTKPDYYCNAIIVCTSAKPFLRSRRSFGQVKGRVGQGQACKSLRDNELSGFAGLACYDKVTSSPYENLRDDDKSQMAQTTPSMLTGNTVSPMGTAESGAGGRRRSL